MRLAALARYFEGRPRPSLRSVRTHASGDMAVLAVHRSGPRAEMAVSPAQDWSLRVTLVYRRDRWQAARPGIGTPIRW